MLSAMSTYFTEDAIPITNEQLPFCIDTPLYVKRSDRYVLYKSANTVPETDIGNVNLYVMKEDSEKVEEEIFSRRKSRIYDGLVSNDIRGVKDTFVNMVSDLFREPRVGNLNKLAESVDMVVENAYDEKTLAKFAMISDNDYSTAVHSSDVMGFAMAYGISQGYSNDKTKMIGLCGLMHDVGKTKVDPAILCSPNGLTDEEFKEIKKHPGWGYEILDGVFDAPVQQVALLHHERCDGSGYPSKIKQSGEIAKLISIIDVYDALTNETRTYREPLRPKEALKIIQKETLEGMFCKETFKSFVRMLGSI